VAARLDLSEGAVAKRLERSRLILRRVLTTELSREAAAHTRGRGYRPQVTPFNHACQGHMRGQALYEHASGSA